MENLRRDIDQLIRLQDRVSSASVSHTTEEVADTLFDLIDFLIDKLEKAIKDQESDW
jgi:hypothetical protein